MRTVLERLLDYTAFDTQSDETTGTHPQKNCAGSEPQRSK